MIYALVIAIDNYPLAHHRLNGCVNDAKSMVAYLEGNYECEELDINTCFDAQATRANVIASFDHFKAATKDDTCLLYYSGHGSQATSPMEFRHLDSDGKVETIVCHDSRLPGGFDLIDKELSYLIWEATQKNNPHFVAIFDCCNSGTNTRGANDPSVKARMAETARNIPQGRTAHGNAKFASATVNGQVQMTPPRGRHVQLAAARPDQLAKELKIGNKTRGAFTYNLIATLEQFNGRITYNELITNLRTKVKNYVDAQVPQIDSSESEDKNLEFLGAIPKNRAQNYTVIFDKKRNSWVINGGAMHNWPEDRASEIELRVKHGSKMVNATVTEVDIMDSTLSGLDTLDKEGSYQATLDKLPAKMLQLAFAPTNRNDKAEKLVRKTIKDNPSPYFELQRNHKKADYWIRIVKDTLRLTAPGDDRPVFRRLTGLTADNAAIFVADTTKVAHWHHVREISNPRTSIKPAEYNIELLKVDEPGAWAKDDNCSASPVDWRQEVVFNYDFNKAAQKESEKWLQPAFRMRIKNTSQRTLHFSAVAILADYTITNKFLAKQTLKPGEETFLLDRLPNGDVFKCIPLTVYDAMLAYDINEVTEQVKVFVSTMELFTDDFNQKGLVLDNPKKETGTRMGRGSANVPPQDDWLTEDIRIKVVRPIKETKIDGGKSAKVGDMLRVEMPKGVNGLLTLNGRAEATRNLSDSTPLPSFPPGWSDQDLGKGMHQNPPANILELYQLEGMENVNVDNPIKIKMPKLDKDEFLVPVGFDPESGLYFPLGVMEEDGTVLIEDLPVPTTSGTRSLGGSIKIFFQKKVSKYLPFVYDYPQLAIGKLVDAGDDTTAAAGLKVEYDKELTNVKNAVAAAERVVVYIHGIIGDTTEMPKSAQLVKDTTGKMLQDNYDVVLTFDYENLNTSIKDTAQDLKDRLAALGLVAGHNKTLHLIAHSMGGLVSRWFIEKLEGNQVVNHLYQLGTPNQGSPFGSLYEMATPLLANAVNGAAFVQPYIIPLRVVGKFLDTMFLTLKQMNPESDFLKDLNDGSDPGIPYTIIAGNTQLIAPDIQQQQLSLMKKVMARFKNRGHYDALDLLIFKSPNDIAVSTESISIIPGASDREFPPTVLTCACDHISYFGDPAGLDSMCKVFLEEAS